MMFATGRSVSYGSNSRYIGMDLAVSFIPSLHQHGEECQTLLSDDLLSTIFNGALDSVFHVQCCGSGRRVVPVSRIGAIGSAFEVRLCIRSADSSLFHTHSPGCVASMRNDEYLAVDVRSHC